MVKILDKAINKIKETFKIGQEKDDLALEDNKNISLKKLVFRKDEAERFLKIKHLNWERNLKLFTGDHWALAGVMLPSYKADIVVNKFFSSVRSLVAFETDTKPDPIVEARVDADDEMAEDIISNSRKVENMLDYRWDTAQVPNILTEVYYDRYIFDDGFGMYFWNSEIDDVDFEQIKPQELIVSPGATCIEDADFVIVQKRRSRKWFKANYPDLDISKLKFESVKSDDPYSSSLSGGIGVFTGTSAEYENMAKVYHYFEDEIWATFTEDKLLDISKNRFWESRTPEEQTAELKEKIKEENGEEIDESLIDFKPVRNHLAKPEKPIVHFKGYHLGGEFYSRSLAKQVERLALAINKRKCQIHDNSDAVGNGQWLIDPSVPEDKVRMITSEPGLKIRINPAMAQKVSGTPLPEQVYFDLEDSKKSFDDIMGHHQISRGETSSKRQTAREAIMLRETDVAPVRLLMRNSEVAITKLLNGWVQLMSLFYDQPHYIGKIGGQIREGTGTFLTRDEIPDNLSILIKVGSTLPTSKETKRVEYQQDFARGVLDPLTYLELMNYPNPRKVLERLLNFQRGIIGEGQGQMQAPMITPRGEQTGLQQLQQPQNQQQGQQTMESVLSGNPTQ